MDKILEQTLLYDFYGELLTAHQKQIYEDVVFRDYSLTEVAEANKISRQGVHDLIHRCNKALHEYEEKLGLMKKFEETRKLVAEIHDLTDEFDRTGDKACVRKIAEISEQIGEL